MQKTTVILNLKKELDIVEKIKVYWNLYSGDTARRYDYPLADASETGKYGSVSIVRIKDELAYEGDDCIE